MSTKITKSSGNVYADLCICGADEHALKAELVRQIALIVRENKLTQRSAPHRLGIAQRDFSRMLKGHFRQFPLNRLMRFLVTLGRDVQIVVRAAAASTKLARLTVSASH
jgi:predicted XRE-type DNA-binding protein